ncbi:cytochrome P450 4d8-like [Haematobia irritans]|uniref:cytochrome P450 4d8-like n=1 Tax=Haematobia irritans TaxID=7368 RepID=UPI003F5058CA
MYVLIIVLLIFALAYIQHSSGKYKRNAVSNIPGPYSWPLLGCIQDLLTASPKSIWVEFPKKVAMYGSVMRVWALNRLLVFSSDAELNEKVLSSTTHISKLEQYGLLHDWLGVGLLVSDGKKWHSRRRIITPAFHFKILENFLDIFNRQSTILVDCLAANADGTTQFDVYQPMSLYTLDVIAETSMGTKLNAQLHKSSEYISAVNEMTELTCWRFIRIHLNNDLIYALMHPFKMMRQKKLIGIMHNFTRNIIEERRATLITTKSESNSSVVKEDTDDIGTKKRSALLDVLLQSTIDGQPLTNEDIREEVETFMFEGHDTTATALSFTLYLLARNPRVQQKLLAEIHQIYGNDLNQPFTLMNLNELKYMECVIKESLRLYPAIPLIGRYFRDDFKYSHSSLGSGLIPAGTQFVISIFGTMNDPKQLKCTHPNQFRPERFENLDASSSFYAIPFSAGPRNCIGQKFAMYEMKVALTKILHTYELLPLGPNVEPIVNIVLRSETGMQLGMRKRLLN